MKTFLYNWKLGDCDWRILQLWDQSKTCIYVNVVEWSVPHYVAMCLLPCYRDVVEKGSISIPLYKHIATYCLSMGQTPILRMHTLIQYCEAGPLKRIPAKNGYA